MSRKGVLRTRGKQNIYNINVNQCYLHSVALFFDCKARPVTLCVGLAAFKLFGSGVLWKTGTLCRPSALT